MYGLLPSYGETFAVPWDKRKNPQKNAIVLCCKQVQVISVFSHRSSNAAQMHHIKDYSRAICSTSEPGSCVKCSVPQIHLSFSSSMLTSSVCNHGDNVASWTTSHGLRRKKGGKIHRGESRRQEALCFSSSSLLKSLFMPHIHCWKVFSYSCSPTLLLTQAVSLVLPR